MWIFLLSPTILKFPSKKHCSITSKSYVPTLFEYRDKFADWVGLNEAT
jgi:hypothetical protein